jgi:hypothetical protein
LLAPQLSSRLLAKRFEQLRTHLEPPVIAPSVLALTRQARGLTS